MTIFPIMTVPQIRPRPHNDCFFKRTMSLYCMTLLQRTPQSTMTSKKGTRMCWPRWKRGCPSFVSLWFRPTTPLPTRPLTPRASAVCGALAGANGAVGTLQPSYPYIVVHSTHVHVHTWNCVCLENYIYAITLKSCGVNKSKKSHLIPFRIV